MIYTLNATQARTKAFSANSGVTVKKAPMLDPQGAYSLAVAVLLQACRDAAKGDTEARAWLVQDGLDYAELLGIDQNAVKRWAKDGLKCPKKTR